MKNFDLNKFGLDELTNRQLVEFNGGQPALNPWLFYAKEIANVVVFLAFKIVDDLSERASKDGYVPYADIGHR